MSDISETYNSAYDIGWEPNFLLDDSFTTSETEDDYC